jgi:predicted AAA+ superfamily ATPase
MKIKILEEILLDQKEMEVDSFNPAEYCTRPEEQHLNLDSRLAQVVIGVRRCGKSTLCMNVLKKSGLPFAYVNFDDERLVKLKGDDLNDILTALYKVYGRFKILFIDEMQNIPEWFLFANRLLRQKMRLVITGSNAKLLSGELATHLTGRYMETRLYPFSFMEYCVCRGVKTSLPASTIDTAERMSAFDSYLKNGGFPELLNEPDTVGYVSSLVESIVHRDICSRHRIRNAQSLSELANHVLNIAPAKATISGFSRLFSIASDHTTRNYLDYLEKAFLIGEVRKYSPKSAERLVNSKIYPIDVALMDMRPNAFAGENLGWRLEALVYHELRRKYETKGYDIYYYEDRTSEADFLVCKGRHVEKIVQVSYDISSVKVRNRELRGAQSAANATGCRNLMLVTYDDREQTLTPSGMPIEIIPAHEWFCKADK